MNFDPEDRRRADEYRAAEAARPAAPTEARIIVAFVAVVGTWVLASIAGGTLSGLAIAALAAIGVPAYLFRDELTPARLNRLAAFVVPALVLALWVS